MVPTETFLRLGNGHGVPYGVTYIWNTIYMVNELLKSLFFDQ